MSTTDDGGQLPGVLYSHFTLTDGSIIEKSSLSKCHWCTRCCCKGYFWAVIASLYFFVILPAGLLLVIHGHHKGVLLTLCLGIAVISVSSCGVPGAYLGIRYYAHKRRKKLKAAKAMHDAMKEKAAFVNGIVLESSLQDSQILPADA